MGAATILGWTRSRAVDTGRITCVPNALRDLLEYDVVLPTIAEVVLVASLIARRPKIVCKGDLPSWQNGRRVLERLL